MEAWSITLLSITNLRLLAQQIRSVAETPTFSRRLADYIGQLQEAMQRLIDEYPNVPEQVARSLAHTFSYVVKFLAGSTSKRIPYEIAYALELALKDWMPKPAIVTTAISPDLLAGYYFEGVPESFYNQIEMFLKIRIDDRLVQISLPEIYRHRPLYCTPLYHELGHFVDAQFGVTQQWLLSTPPENLQLPGLPPAGDAPHLDYVHQSHRMEYFADIFSAIYSGNCVSEFLSELTGVGQKVTATHPATADRVALVNAVLSEAPNAILASLRPILQQLGLPSITKRFSPVDVSSTFDNMHPASIQGDNQVHGIFPAAWNYLKGISALTEGSWKNVPSEMVEQTINNLLEKSIRNCMIVEKWHGSAR